MLGTSTQTIIGRPILPDAAVHAVVEEHVSVPPLFNTLTHTHTHTHTHTSQCLCESGRHQMTMVVCPHEDTTLPITMKKYFL